MNPDLSEKALNKIESLCELGCTSVKQILDDANGGKKIEQLAEFNDTEIRLIIVELDQIMSVYVKDSHDKDSSC
ncbi:MAG: hypothetical protein GQ549_02415 [Gammaproteobacteria bacterium]|nr:hypothetical protein [Gammaproteobacteria bacterium]